MKINENVHLIRKDFYVTEDIKRYVNIYLITGKYCYLIDSGVSGSETLIAEYLESIGRKMTEQFLREMRYRLRMIFPFLLISKSVSQALIR